MWMGKNLNTNDPNLNLDSNISLPKLFPITQLTQTNTNHHFLKSAAAEENEQPVPAMGSSRWSPTPEQLLALEEMYRLGTRSPTAEQIQEIAVQLRRFGKIEGKNVFYWFQNHKARERQKRRRGVETNSKTTTIFNIENIEKKQLSAAAADKWLRRTVHEVEETNNLVPHSGCSVHTEGHVSMHRTARMAESRVHEWSQLEKRNLQQQQKKKQEYTWQAARKFLSFQELHQEPTMTQIIKTNLGDEIKEIETLELFPLFREDEDDENGPKKDRKVPIQAINTAENLQFFEFLPLKN